MVAGSITDECPLAVPAGRLWKAAFNTDVSIYPKACVGVIDSIVVEGGGGPGSITTTKFSPAIEEGGVMKTRLVLRDGAARVIKTEVVEGGEVASQFKSQVTEVKLEATGDDACVAKLRVDYERHDGAMLSPEDQTKITQGYLGLLKQVEAYLVAHPAEYA